MGKQNAFKKIATAQASGGGNHIRDGKYKFLIDKVFIHEGDENDSFIAELRVMESEPSGEVDAAGRPIAPNPVGSTCSFVCNFKFKSAGGNAKAFVMAAVGCTEEELTPEQLAFVCSDDNPLRGVAIIDETYRGVNKGRDNPANAGKPLTLNRWKHVSQTEADVAEGKKYLDSTAAKEPEAPAKDTTAPTAPAAAPSGALGNLLRMK
jgi:hypothetical protein